MNGQINHQTEQARVAARHDNEVGARVESESTEGLQTKRHAILSAFATVMAVTAMLYSLPIHAANGAPTALRAV